MNINKFGLMPPKRASRLLLISFIAVGIICPSVIAKSIQVKDQFGNPIVNVVVSFTATDSMNIDKLDVLVMDQIDKQFEPRVLVVHKNQTVSFPNSDNIRHHLYSFSQPKSFEFKMFKGGESKQLTFDQAGIVVLGCNIHDQMVGYIYVADNEHTVVTNEQGLAELPSAASAVKLWHSNYSANKIERKDVQLSPSDPEAPIAITLVLLADTNVPTTSKFKSNKFNRGN